VLSAIIRRGPCAPLKWNVLCMFRRQMYNLSRKMKLPISSFVCGNVRFQLVDLTCSMLCIKLLLFTMRLRGKNNNNSFIEFTKKMIRKTMQQKTVVNVVYIAEIFPDYCFVLHKLCSKNYFYTKCIQ
jgi:hypothetical protein